MNETKMAEIRAWANTKLSWNTENATFGDPKCWRCDKPTVTYSNVTMNMASSVESRFEPCCEDHAMMEPLDMESRGRRYARELLEVIDAFPETPR